MNTPQDTTARSTPRSLRRSHQERMLAGVCGGIAEYLRVDPNLIRLALVVLTMAGGSGAFLYLVGWLLIPEDGSDVSELQRLLQR